MDRCGAKSALPARTSQECGEDALRKAAAAVTEDIPGRPPDTALATAWAAIGQGWAALATAEAARSAATAAIAIEQTGISVSVVTSTADA